MPYLELEGQEEVLTFLRETLAGARAATSYLLIGTEGVTEQRLAAEWAKAVNCPTNRLFESCDCASCGKIERRTHPDVHWFGLDEQARSLKIGEVRELQAQANLQPFEGKKKVFILVGADRLTEEASNALLKILEEPPAQCLFILITAWPEKLMPTVLSRLVKVSLKPLAPPLLGEILSRNLDWSREEVQFLSAECEGSLGRAIKLHEEGFFALKNQWIDAFIQEGKQSFFSQLNSTDRPGLKKVFQALASFFRDILIWKATHDGSLLIHQDRGKDIQTWAERWPTKQLARNCELLEQAQDDLRQNLNARLILLRLAEKL